MLRKLPVFFQGEVLPAWKLNFLLIAALAGWFL